MTQTGVASRVVAANFCASSMSIFQPIPLGRCIPGSPHSVACSLPTLRDIIGYEEGQPETTRHITSHVVQPRP